MSRSKDGWIRCDGKRVKCPICESDWCTISPDESLACCMRCESDWPAKNGGWIHRLKDDISPPPKRRHPKVEEEDPPWDRSIADMTALFRGFQERTNVPRIQDHAAALGVSVDSLVRVGIAWAGPYKAWAFPMYDIKGRIVGIRLRSETGDKWAIKGSRQGLFWPKGNLAAGASVLVCEGPTDTAAALDLGFFAFGRPACRGMEEPLATLLTGMDVVIMADRDEPKVRPDGTQWRPGQEGAEALALALFGRARTIKIVYPALNKGKDIRAWLRAGATHYLLKSRIVQTPVWTPKEPVNE